MIYHLTEAELCNFADVRDEEGKSPLDITMENMYIEGCPEVAHYLMSHGSSDSDEKTLTKLLSGACRRGKLDIVKELVEQQKLDPKSE